MIISETIQKGLVQTYRFSLLLPSLILIFAATLASAEESVQAPKFAATLSSAEKSAQALKIDKLQQLGLQANGLVRAARSQIDIAEANVVSASAFLNPKVTVIAGNHKRRLPLEVTGPSGTVREILVSQPIENPFLRSARIGSAEALVDAREANLDQVRADLAAQLRVRAYEMILRQEQAQMETSIYDLMKEIQRRIKVSVDVGETARFELIRADTEVLGAENRMEAARLNAERARVALIQLTAGALQSGFEIDASLSDPVEFPPLETLQKEIALINPDIQRLEAEQNSADKRISQEKASVLPSLNILYSNFQDKQFTSNAAGVNVEIPLFYRRRGQIDNAIYDSARIRDTLEYRRFEISQLLESAWQALKIARRRVEMFEGGIVTEAELALSIAQTAYRLGERGFMEVLDTQRVLRGVLADLLQARFELQSAAAEIDRLRANYPEEQPIE